MVYLSTTSQLPRVTPIVVSGMEYLPILTSNGWYHYRPILISVSPL